MKHLVAIWALFIGLAGCGPEESNLDKETEQMDQLYQKTRDVLATLAGDYDGTITNDGGRKVKVLLRLRSFSVFVPSPNRIELIEVPNLLGHLAFAGDTSLTFTFNEGNFDQRTSTLKLKGSGNAGGFFFMQLQREGKALFGELIRNNLVTPIELTKIVDAK